MRRAELVGAAFVSRHTGAAIVMTRLRDTDAPAWQQRVPF